jgi:hypothetical protein
MEPDVGVKAPKPGLVFDNCEHSKLTLRHRGIIRNFSYITPALQRPSAYSCAFQNSLAVEAEADVPASQFM